MTDNDIGRDNADRFRREHPALADQIAWAHSMRFRKVSNRYAHEVAEAYGGDIIRALADTDAEVAARVAESERAQGRTPRDWHALGASERGDDE